MTREEKADLAGLCAGVGADNALTPIQPEFEVPKERHPLKRGCVAGDRCA